MCIYSIYLYIYIGSLTVRGVRVTIAMSQKSFVARRHEGKLPHTTHEPRERLSSNLLTFTTGVDYEIARENPD